MTIARSGHGVMRYYLAYLVRKSCVSYDLYMHNIPKATCGLFGVSDDYIESYQSLDEKFIRNKSSTFFFEATGDSMEPLIISGDVLVVDKAQSCNHGDIAVIYLEGTFMCKRIHKTSSSVTLVSENKNHQDININEEMDFLLWGVVIATARDMRGK